MSEKARNQLKALFLQSLLRVNMVNRNVVPEEKVAATLKALSSSEKLNHMTMRLLEQLKTYCPKWGVCLRGVAWWLLRS